MKDGILVIDKPEGITSHDVVNSVRKIVGTKKVGHAGTLDPFATGVLIVGVNQGTKLLPFLQIDDKEYEAVVRLGIETDTLDKDGMVIRETNCPIIGRDEMEKIMAAFVGCQSQVPPAYSAIKKEGVPLYKLARKGVEVEVLPREIIIYGITLKSLEIPDMSFTVRCSSGTYVRSLARDIGIKVGCGGHLKSLRRTRSGSFGADKAITLLRLKEMSYNWADVAISLRDALLMQEVLVDRAKAEIIRMGKRFYLDDISPTTILKGRFKLTCDGELVAVAEMGEGGKLLLIRVFNP